MCHESPCVWCACGVDSAFCWLSSPDPPSIKDTGATPAVPSTAASWTSTAVSPSPSSATSSPELVSLTSLTAGCECARRPFSDRGPAEVTAEAARAAESATGTLTATFTTASTDGDGSAAAAVPPTNACTNADAVDIARLRTRETTSVTRLWSGAGLNFFSPATLLATQPREPRSTKPGVAATPRGTKPERMLAARTRWGAAVADCASPSVELRSAAAAKRWRCDPCECSSPA